MRYPLRSALVTVVSVVPLLACGGSDEEEAEVAEVIAEPPSIMIVGPADGSDFDDGRIQIRLQVTGVTIVPAGMEMSNSGHHHLFINRDPTPVGETIPAEEGIVHLGAAQTEYTFTDLAPGEYTITAVLGDHLHTRIPGIEPHSVTVEVTGPGGG